MAATFYSFSPQMVAEHLPAVWSVAAPEKVAQARMQAVDRALRALLGDVAEGPEVAEPARLAREAAEGALTAGRPLAAANGDLAWPEEPHLQLWQATTVLREHRGDGHVAALLDAGLDPCEALVSFAAVGAAPVEAFTSRAGHRSSGRPQDRLTTRGWVSPDGRATERGRQGRDEVERRTDNLAVAPWLALGAARGGRLAQLTVPLMQAVVVAGILPRQSTLGLGGNAA